MRRTHGLRTAALIAAAALVSLAVAVTGWSQDSRTTWDRIPSEDGVYGACFTVSTGALRVVPADQGCDVGERRISWNRTGPRGAAGAPGADGQTFEIQFGGSHTTARVQTAPFYDPRGERLRS